MGLTVVLSAVRVKVSADPDRCSLVLDGCQLELTSGGVRVELVFSRYRVARRPLARMAVMVGSIFVVAKIIFFERFEFLVRSCECAVPRLCPRISISNVVVFVTIHDDMFLYVHIYKRCLPK